MPHKDPCRCGSCKICTPYLFTLVECHECHGIFYKHQMEGEFCAACNEAIENEADRQALVENVTLAWREYLPVPDGWRLLAPEEPVRPDDRLYNPLFPEKWVVLTEREWFIGEPAGDQIGNEYPTIRKVTI